MGNSHSVNLATPTSVTASTPRFDKWSPPNLVSGLAAVSTSICLNQDNLDELKTTHGISCLTLILFILYLIVVPIMITAVYYEERMRCEYKSAKKTQVKPQLTPDYLEYIHERHQYLSSSF